MTQLPQVLICSSAWKESLSSTEANMIIREALSRYVPSWRVDTLPFSDGGDGWLEALTACWSGSVTENVVDAMGPLPNQRVHARYLWSALRKTLLLEAAEIHGMRRLPGGVREPLVATSYGVGEALIKLYKQHPTAKHIIVSVGGSASTDCGVGFLQAMGWAFYTRQGELLTNPVGAGDLHRIHRVSPGKLPPNFPEITLLVDVQTPYVDAPRLFGPQKGLSSEDILPVTTAFTHVAQLLDAEGALQHLPGTGAAGGLPFGVLASGLEVSMQSGVAWTAAAIGLENALQEAALVITGEGCLDDTSLMGKGTGYLIEETRRLQKPLIIFCGQNRLSQPLPLHVQVISLYEAGQVVPNQAFAIARETLSRTVSASLSTIAQRLEAPLA